MTAQQQIEDAVAYLQRARSLIDELQQHFKHGNTLAEPGDAKTVNMQAVWHALETIDDKVFDALGKLGD